MLSRPNNIPSEAGAVTGVSTAAYLYPFAIVLEDGRSKFAELIFGAVGIVQVWNALSRVIRWWNGRNRV